MRMYHDGTSYCAGIVRELCGNCAGRYAEWYDCDMKMKAREQVDVYKVKGESNFLDEMVDFRQYSGDILGTERYN